MADIPVYIARDGLELGLFVSSDVLVLLEEGFLRPDDTFWLDDLPGHRPLSELDGFLKSQQIPLLQKVKGTVLSAAGVVKEGAVSAAVRMSSIAGRGRTEATAATTKVLEDYLPAIRQHVATVIRQGTRSATSVLRDDTVMRKVFGAVYDMLPKPVRRFVSEERFILFCFEHRQKLFFKDGDSGS